MPLTGSEQAGIGSVPTAAGADSPGVTPVAPTPTLAAVYAAGAGAPATDDVMGMLLGTTLRFQANSNGANLPYIGGFETTAALPIVSSGLPADAWALYDGTGGNFGRLFHAHQMFSPSWDGTFAGIDPIGGVWQIEDVSYSNAASTSWTGGTRYGVRSYTAEATTPEGSPGGGTGRAMFHKLALYNTIGDGVADVEWVDGWGQQRNHLTPTAHGLTWQLSTHWQSIYSGGTAAGDGVGWAIFESPLNHDGGDQKRGALTCKALDTAGNWQWSFLVNDGSDNWFDVADFSKAGITFNVPTSNPGTGNVPIVYKSQVIDFSVLTSGTIVIIPAAPGYYAEVVLIDVFSSAVGGTATTNVLLQAGNNATQDNIIANTSAIATTVQNAVIAAGAPSKVAGLAVPSGATAKLLVDMATPATLDITQAGAGTGGYVFKGYIRVVYTLHPM